MPVLALDIGSSSVKAALLDARRAPRRVARVSFATSFSDVGGMPRAEARLPAIERAVCEAISQLGTKAARVDLIAATTMAPSWLAMRDGKALTAVVTHQDRRSVREAAEIEARVGTARHLKLAGNRPFPGGISSTTCAWFLRHERAAMKRATLVGHLGTWLAVALTGERVIDRSNAGFTGLMDVRTGEWNDELVDAVGTGRSLLPEIVDSDAIVGEVTTPAARRFGLREGTPVLAGCIDGSAAMLAAGAAVGQLVNVCGSTDVLALCTKSPHPHADLLTRPLGVDGKWLSVATIAAAGSAIEWVGRTFFSELPIVTFHVHVTKIARSLTPTAVTFEPLLAGSRTAMTIERGTIRGLTLGTDRDEVLRSLITDLRRRSGERLTQFKALGLPMKQTVFSTGGGATLAAKVLRADWPKRLRYREESEATLRGLQVLAARVR